MGIEALNPSFYADPAGLDGLKRNAAEQTPQALREAARQFESLFTNMMLKSMRSASEGDPLFGSDQADFYQDMFDQQLAVELGKGKGLGLADMLVRQLQGKSGAGATNPAAAKQAPDVTKAPDITRGSDIAKGADLTSTWPPRSREDFINAIRPAATAAASQLGVDADTIIAHAALETGWGQSVPTGRDGKPGFNLFGIKASGDWQGAATQSATHEFTAGSMQRTSASFRAYDSPEQSVGDYVRLLKGNTRYAAALGTGSDANAFARGLASGGYATDPDYVAKLTAVAARLKSGNFLPLNNPSTREVPSRG
jgi:flagellar protein FlgJ